MPIYDVDFCVNNTPLVLTFDTDAEAERIKEQLENYSCVTLVWITQVDSDSYQD